MLVAPRGVLCRARGASAIPWSARAAIIAAEVHSVCVLWRWSGGDAFGRACHVLCPLSGGVRRADRRMGAQREFRRSHRRRFTAGEMRSAVGRLLPRAGLLRAAGGAAGRLAQAGEGVAAGAAAAVSPASVGAEARGLASASSVGSRGIWSSPRGIADAGFARSGALSASPERQAYYSLAVRTLQTSRGSLVDAPAAQPANRIAVGEPVPIGGVHYKVIGRLELGKAFQVAKKDLFAVVEVGPHQFKVTTDDLIYVEKLGDVDINDKVRILWFSPREVFPTSSLFSRFHIFP